MTPERWAAVDPDLRAAWERLVASSTRRFHDADPEGVALGQRVFRRCGPDKVRFPPWFGGGGQQFPADYVAYQEVLWQTGSQVLIETGTGSGGTTRFFDECLSRRYPGGDYRIITVDNLLEPAPYLAERPAIVGLIGDSADPAIAACIQEHVPTGWPVTVTLDSDHDARHVLAELELYAPLVTSGHHLIVQDTFLGLYWGGNLDAVAAERAHQAGDTRAHDYVGCPLGAIEAFLAVHGDDWEVDLEPTRFVCTQNPYGFLRRRR